MTILFFLAMKMETHDLIENIFEFDDYFSISQDSLSFAVVP